MPLPLLTLLALATFTTPAQPPAAAPQTSPPAETRPLPAQPAYLPTRRYVVRHVEGWEVLVHPDLLHREKEIGGQALRELEVQLYAIKRQVPPEAVLKLQQVRLWLERDEPHHPCATYHPNRDWLVEHGMNPDKYQCVEISNATTFVVWTRDLPWMLLHELSHAYHDQFLPEGFQNPEILACFQAAVKNHSYEAVPHIRRKEKVRSYALTNQMEYFAEASEAYFGAGDYYPFNKYELEQHDPDLWRAVVKLWGVANPEPK